MLSGTIKLAATLVVLAALTNAGSAVAGSLETLGTKMASNQLQDVTDRTIADYFGGLIRFSESHRDDCGATMAVASGSLPVSRAILALRRVTDCAGPKPILALRLTVTQAGAEAVGAAMRPNLGKPCLDGPGAMKAPSLVWSDSHRLLGIVQDTPQSMAFSVFFVSHDVAGSSDADAEQALRRMLEADFPPSCRSRH